MRTLLALMWLACATPPKVECQCSCPLWAWPHDNMPTYPAPNLSITDGGLWLQNGGSIFFGTSP